MKPEAPSTRHPADPSAGFSAGLSRLHVSLNVADLTRSIEFYRKLFDTEPAKVRPDYAKFEVADPPLNFTMNATTQPAGTCGNLSHMGIQLGSSQAVREARERVEAAGITARTEEAVTCCYSLQDKFWVQDPDGNAWEYFVVLRDTASRAGESAPSACC